MIDRLFKENKIKIHHCKCPTRFLYVVKSQINEMKTELVFKSASVVAYKDFSFLFFFFFFVFVCFVFTMLILHNKKKPKVLGFHFFKCWYA